jgi:hypothetical protein
MKRKLAAVAVASALIGGVSAVPASGDVEPQPPPGPPRNSGKAGAAEVAHFAPQGHNVCVVNRNGVHGGADCN